MTSAEASHAEASLARHLSAVVVELEPAQLGLYWPHRFEFNAAALVTADERLAALPLALPFARRRPPQMQYRTWKGQTPTIRDDCGIPSSDGAEVVPEVVVVPCVGFTPAGFRLGYGGGYFDRWLALHPHVTAVGVAWSGSELDSATFRPEPHDLALAFIVTEDGPV